MEYLILFIVYWLIPIIVSRLILPKHQLLMMSPMQSIITPYIVIGLMIYVFTVILTIIRALRTCPVEKDQTRSYGITSGLKLGFSSSIVGALMYFVVGILPMLMLPFLAISVLPYSTEIGEGFYVAIGGFIGYWLGRIFIGIC